jgi:8-oxo-dGTP pyrophosphatase MutT (NUDIX family)
MSITPTSWPDYDLERTSVRVVLLATSGRFLLFETIDPGISALGVWWELPGGGMEPGEDVIATAVRELAEETGFVVPTSAVEQSRWRRSATYLRRGIRTLQHEHVVVIRWTEPDTDPARDARTAEELTAYIGHRWWSLQELAASSERFFPGRLAELLPRMLAGELIDESFEHWN